MSIWCCYADSHIVIIIIHIYTRTRSCHHQSSQLHIGLSIVIYSSEFYSHHFSSIFLRLRGNPEIVSPDFAGNFCYFKIIATHTMQLSQFIYVPQLKKLLVANVC